MTANVALTHPPAGDWPDMNEELPMVRPQNKRERATHRNEHPGEHGMRISIALDRENQPWADERARVVTYRAAAAMTIARLRASEATP